MLELCHVPTSQMTSNGHVAFHHTTIHQSMQQVTVAQVKSGHADLKLSRVERPTMIGGPERFRTTVIKAHPKSAAMQPAGSDQSTPRLPTRTYFSCVSQ